MSSLQAAVKNELFLMAYRKKTIVFAAFSALLPILLAVSLHALQPQLVLLSISGSYPVQMLELYTLCWIPLFIIFTLADQFPQETSSRTLKLTLLRPITRFRVFLAKSAALGIGIGALLLLLGIESVICGAFAGTPGTTADWFTDMKGYAAAYVSMLALAALFTLVAQLFQSVNGYLVFSIIMYAAAKLLPFFVRPFAAFSVTSYTDWYVLWLGGGAAPMKLLTTGLFVVSGAVLFFSLGYFMFDRKES